MSVTYDKHYETENLFGNPYPELIAFFESLPRGSSVLDLGCGQGRDAIALARLGFSVTGIDNSQVGIDQMLRIAAQERLSLKGITTDIFAYDAFSDDEVILLDSMFHFAKKDRKREIALIDRIASGLREGGLLIVCIQDSGNKVEVLNAAIDSHQRLNQELDRSFTYLFEDTESGHRSETKYRMFVWRAARRPLASTF